LLNRPWEQAVEEDDRKPEGEQRRCVPKAPGKPKLPGAARCALPPAGNKRRYGSEVIRVSCVAESKQNCDSENDPYRCAVGGCRDSLVEAEHQFTSGQAATE
jgi:hypothetical protein